MKSKEETVQDMEKIGYEQISEEDFDKVAHVGETQLCHPDGDLFFKPKEQTFFEDESYKINISPHGLELRSKIIEKTLPLGKSKSLPLLIKAIAIGQELYGWEAEE